MGADGQEQKFLAGKFCLVAVCDDDHRVSSRDGDGKEDLQMIMRQDTESSSSFSPSFDDGSAALLASSSSSSHHLLDDDDDDDDDDATSSSSSSPNSNDVASLFDLSEIMSQLPIKRGLSKFYAGKSQSFTSLARVTSLEDLAKKGGCGGGGYGRRMKACKSYGGGLNNPQKSSVNYSPKPTISKKSSSSSSFSSRGALSLSCLRRNGSNLSRCNSSSGKPPISPVQSSF